MSQVAMFSRTGSTEFPTFLKCMITGPPKSGKTTLLGTVPNILILDTEPHANNLQSVAHLDLPYKTITSTDDLRQALFVLSQDQFRRQAAEALGLPDIEAVAIDTLDTLQGIMKRERMREQRTTQFLRDDWGWLKEEMTSMLESFLALPMHVFFVVHTKTKEVGTEKNPRTIVLPGLEGGISESIAGMVGYSLLSFRKEEIRSDGTKYTKYWLRAEGDETYEYLGNRAAGRLPDIIEPDFKSLLAAAMANRPTEASQQIPVELTGVQTTGQMQQAPQPAPAAEPAQNQGQSPAPAPAATQSTQNGASGAPGTPSGMPGDDEPVNAAALTHVKRVYDALGQSFPEDKIKALNLGQARGLVRMWKAAQQDEAEGNLEPGQNAAESMLSYLRGNEWLADAPQQEEAKQIQPKIDGTIDEVRAWVGDGSDLARVNDAYEAERAGKARATLLNWLESKGASQNRTPVQIEEAPEPVTPAPTAADASPEEQQVALVQDRLGGEVIGSEINPNAACQECGNQIDDVDLAQLGKSRFGRVLCVADYIAETKK